MSFQKYLLSIGYSTFRVDYVDGVKTYAPSVDDYFSTYSPGKLDIRYLKDGHEIVFGLHEKDKPPTLIYPRPKGVESDDDMNRMLADFEPERIYELIK